MNGHKVLLVGDNPFLGVSHLTQERAIARGNELSNPYHCAALVKTALDNGADGFMFTISEKTLSILKIVTNDTEYNRLQLYAIVPYVPELVRSAAISGGIPGLATRIGRGIAFSGNPGALMNAIKGAIGAEPASLVKSYLSYEISRLKSVMNNQGTLVSVMWHEVVTDMALALNMRWLFETHIEFMLQRAIKPGFETRNFAYLVSKLEEWGMDFSKVTIAAPFNAAGFQICPSKDECERTLARNPEMEVVGFSILAAGYLKLPEAIEYVANLFHLKGVAVGASKKQHAYETFKLLKEELSE